MEDPSSHTMKVSPTNLNLSPTVDIDLLIPNLIVRMRHRISWEFHHYVASYRAKSTFTPPCAVCTVQPVPLGIDTLLSAAQSYELQKKSALTNTLPDTLTTDSDPGRRQPENREMAIFLVGPLQPAGQLRPTWPKANFPG